MTGQPDNKMQSEEKQLQALSKNPNKAGQEMLDTIRVLHSIYQQENDALAKADTRSFLLLQDDKLAAARLYQERVREMMERKDEMKDMEPSLKNKLEEMQTEFTTLAKTNGELLERMQSCMERLGNVIRKAAKQAAREQHTYNYDERGSISRSENKGVSTGISETA